MCQTTLIFGITKDGSLYQILKHHEIVSLAETSFKMALTICQKCLIFETAFCKKAQNFVQFGSSDFDQISPACGKHSY